MKHENLMNDRDKRDLEKSDDMRRKASLLRRQVMARLRVRAFRAKEQTNEA